MRRQLMAGNWKMNKNIDEAVALAEGVAREVGSFDRVDVVVFPPFIAIPAVAQAIRNGRVAVGAQNMHYAEGGAYTGEISPLMLVGFCRFVILGHSERRQLFGESDDLIARKTKSALDHGLTPILCVGETLEQRQQGLTEDTVTRQAGAALRGLDAQQLEHIVVAYEPVWAIGTGQTATPQQAAEAITTIRSFIQREFAASDSLRILYGGSVNARVWRPLAEQEQIDGALVGGASLNASEFIKLVEISQATRGQ